MPENQEKIMLSIKETAELLGMGESTLSKKLHSFSVKGIVKEKKRIWIPLSSIPELKKELNYNDKFDKGKYYSTAEVTKKLKEKGLKVKRSDISNWVKKGKVKTILHMGYRYIHEKDLHLFINYIKIERAIPVGYCTLEEAANILGMHPQTIRKWAANGDIESVRVILNGYWKTLVKKNLLKTVKRKMRINMLRNFANVDLDKVSENNKKNETNSINRDDIDSLSLDNYLEVKDAVKLLGIQNNTLWTLLRTGKFPSAVKIKNKWYIQKEEISSYQKKLNAGNRTPSKVVSENSSLDGYLTILEVSNQINLSKSRTSALIHENMFPNAIKVKNKWLIPQDDILSYQEMKKQRKNLALAKNKQIDFQSQQGYLSTKEVAKELNISSGVVTVLIKNGKLRDAIKPGKTWKIPESSLIEYKSQKENNQISITKPDLINELNQFINSVQNKEHLKETFRLYSDFTTTRLNATNGRINNVRRVFNHLKRLFSDIIINLKIEISDLPNEDIEAVMKNSSYSNPIRELFLKFLKEAFLIKGKKLDKEYVLSRKGKKSNVDIDSERYTPEVYYLFEQHVKDIEKHISPAIKNRQYANMWVLTTMLLTNAWRPSDIIFEMPHIDIEVINVLEFDWFKKNRLSPEQCQLIVNQLYLKLNNAEVSKTNADLHFLVAPNMVNNLAYACIISELHCRALRDNATLFETERLLLGTFVLGITENPTTSGTTTHKNFFKDMPELIPFSSKKLHNSTMTYLFLDISEDEDESELALEVVQWARSHEDINVTAGYIKLTNKDGTLDRVSINLFKRGHFGWLYNYMVQLAFSNTGIHQSFEERTKTIEELKKEYTPIQLEAWAKTLLDYKNRKESVVRRLYKLNTEQLREIVINIYKGQMPSRDGCGQCLSFPDCRFVNRKTCIGCINFIPQLQQVLIEAKEEFYRLIDSMKNYHTDAILKRDTVFLFNVLLLFNEAAETFGSDTVNGFLSSEERKNALYSIADKLKLPIVNA
ncbi:helix-turn-helix domain-containing protein [Bacillus benzoevorans]|uniref:Excisionase family DNA binding protein n=1 Tax=Bacillus benzoevorans TaxID=1456 RepID=A0A7X0HW35_9BACI|nr:helix-turn-helix domain-containing protein [Bacillus benzoevorans]MBB6447903.1 excisionase family DNA binding protein [Bacillus benzoevorans]